MKMGNGSKETKEVAVKQNQAVAALTETTWDTENVVEAKDIRIPRALLMQQMSDLVGQRKATAGDIVNSITGEKLADDKAPLKVVPITTFKTWTIEVLKSGKWEWETQEQYTLKNSVRSKEPFDYVDKAGQKVSARAVEVINLLCFLEKDQGSAEALPYVISFRMTSFQCGQQILTERRNAQSANKPFPSYVLELSPAHTKNDKGSFYKFQVTGKSVNQGFKDNALVLKGWFDTFQMGTMKIDEEANASDDTTNSAPKTVSQEY